MNTWGGKVRIKLPHLWHCIVRRPKVHTSTWLQWIGSEFHSSYTANVFAQQRHACTDRYHLFHENSSQMSSFSIGRMLLVCLVLHIIPRQENVDPPVTTPSSAPAAGDALFNEGVRRGEVGLPEEAEPILIQALRSRRQRLGQIVCRLHTRASSGECACGKRVGRGARKCF